MVGVHVQVKRVVGGSRTDEEGGGGSRTGEEGGGGSRTDEEGGGGSRTPPCGVTTNMEPAFSLLFAVLGSFSSP